MRTRKIQVKNGRLVMDEPTDLPEGAEVDVLVIDDDLTIEERAKLHASLDRALEDANAGRATDVWEYLEKYRARREDRLSTPPRTDLSTNPWPADSACADEEDQLSRVLLS